MTEGVEDFSAGPAPSPGIASPTGSPLDSGPVPEEKPEETEAAGESGDESVKGITEEGSGGGGDGDGDGEHERALGIVALPATCCVCIEMEQINHCLQSEKICILPILACLLSLALCTAGLKWVFVDKIFEYDPPTHLDPKPIGQDPIIISVNPTLGITVSIPHSAPSTVSLTTSFAITPGRPEVLVDEKSTARPQTPTYPSVTLGYSAERSTVTKQSPHPQTTQETNKFIQTISTTSTSTTSKTSSHIMRCSDSQKNYCVNGGECFTLEIMPGSTKFLCRKQRKKLRDRLRQSKKNKRKNNTSSGSGSGSNLESSAAGQQNSNVPLQDLKFVNPCNGSTVQQATEETETTFPTSKYVSANQPTTLTNISSQRFASAMTQLSPESKTALTTPGSPPSEMSAPMSSLAISVPSVALSPSVEEERPLLLSKKSQPHMSSRLDEQKRSSSHYNHGHMAHSLPPSPALFAKNVNYGVTDDHDATAASHSFSDLTEKLTNQTNNTSNCITKRAACHVQHYMESSCDSMMFSETEDPRGGDTAFLNADSTTALWIMESSRTNPASPNDDLQVKCHNLVAV
ncbi:pro-neuregulin-1, membrane-bound isoform isoform X5 [Kryptolebias marmoratus]|uniref:pro-neuregulin-1, membrane-bound isoform isoform X5 n=1 Tax=Kryptolebias marmoratus TaxID=37003 RepID=UPI0018ACD8F6|nr:pro-neuregulin-1, membrane-bound isoform isoform X5 [Kryptolebias marmoratus]